MGAGLTESNNTTATQATGSGTLSYSSEQYLLGGFNYNFGLGFGVGTAYINVERDNTNSPEPVEDEKRDSTTGSTSFGHSLSRTWVAGRASTVNLGLSQNLGAGISTEDDSTRYSFGHSLTAGWSTRHLNGSTYGSFSASDARTFSNINSDFQQIQADLNHARTLSRVSAMLASLAVGWSRQAQELDDAGDNQDPVQTAPGFDSSSSTNYFRFLTSYRNSRMFGIYPLRFLARLRYIASNLDEEDEGFANSTVEGDAKFSYNIGLLTTSLTLDATYNLTGTSNYGINFQISRAF